MLRTVTGWGSMESPVSLGEKNENARSRLFLKIGRDLFMWEIACVREGVKSAAKQERRGIAWDDGVSQLDQGNDREIYMDEVRKR